MNVKTRKKIRPVSVARIHELIRIIDAMEGKPCPTDRELSYMMKYAHPTSAQAVVRRAIEMGFIESIGTRKNRRLRVVKSGKATEIANHGKY